MSKRQDLINELKTVPFNSPRRDEIMVDLERITKWMESKGYSIKSHFTSKYPCNVRRDCRMCRRQTLVYPLDNARCSGCGENY